MKTDTYTKIIMTVIAVALVKIAFQDTQAIKPLFAQQELTTATSVCHLYRPLCTDIVRTNNGEALLVKIVD